MGQRILKRRTDLGLLQRQVAEQLGVHVTTVRNWELGHTQPMLVHMPKILRFLGYDPQPESATLGERLKRYRLIHGLTQANLAKLIGVDPSTLASWENNEHSPTQWSKALLQDIGILPTLISGY